MHFPSESFTPGSLYLAPPSPPFPGLSYDLSNFNPYDVADEPSDPREPRAPPNPLDHHLTRRDLVLIQLAMKQLSANAHHSDQLNCLSEQFHMLI